MTISTQEVWFFVLAGVGLFELTKSRGQWWMPVFCALSAVAVLLENAESSIMLMLGFFTLLLQNLQTQTSQTETHLRTQKVILGFVGGLIFLACSLKGEWLGFVSLMLFVFLITTDWPFEGLLKSKQKEDTKEDLVETNAKSLIYVPVSILLALTYTPNQDWVALLLFGLGLILIWGKDKDRALFLLFCGLSWLKPELRSLAPAITVLCLGSTISTFLMQYFVLYLFAVVALPAEVEIAAGVLGVFGILVGWMLADKELPQMKDLSIKHRARDFVNVSIAIIAIVLALVFVVDAEKTMTPQPEYLAFAIAAVLTEVLKRNIQQLKKQRFEKSLSLSAQGVFELIPLFRTQERDEHGYESKSAGRTLLLVPVRLSNLSRLLENGYLSVGIFAVILWSIVIWYYCSI